ncbi:MAG TPA: hypothetical protein VGF65_11155 [Mycobacterium sp.]|jgi:hypothetical protein
MIYGIWCEVSGGRTGPREAWLKRDGTIALWTDRDEATSEALRLTRERNHPNKPVRFFYLVQER